MKHLFILLAISVFSVSCANKKATGKESDPTPQAQKSMESHPKVQVVQGVTLEEGDAFSLQSAGVEGDVMTFVVSYSGGCEDHEFELLNNGMIMKSMPPQSNLVLKHNGNGDKCRALITDTLHFDLSPLQGLANGTLILHINQSKDKFTYTF